MLFTWKYSEADKDCLRSNFQQMLKNTLRANFQQSRFSDNFFHENLHYSR